MSDVAYLVIISHYDDHGGALYRTRDAAENAKQWFDENASGHVSIAEMPLNEGFSPPKDFYANYLGWGYENDE